MKFKKYGIELKRIGLEDIELIRVKRNSPAIMKRMLFQSEITPEQQLEWFHKINNNQNRFYIIYAEGKPIGLINDKNMDWNTRTSEAGIFIWEEEHLKSAYPGLAGLILFEFGYEFLNWSHTLITVRDDNAEALAYNREIGFTEVQRQNGAVLMMISRNEYRRKIRPKILDLTRSFENLPLILEVYLDEKDLIDEVEEGILQRNLEVRKQRNEVSIGYSYLIKE